MNNNQEISEACAQDVEVVLLRQLFEHVRSALRYDGIDAQRVRRAMGEMDMAVERIKLFDSGLMDPEDTHELLHGRSFVSQTYQTCDAYESGYGHGLQLDGHDNVEGELFADPRHNEAYRIGYRKGARLAEAQRNHEGSVEREQARRIQVRALKPEDIFPNSALAVPRTPEASGGEHVAAVR